MVVKWDGVSNVSICPTVNTDLTMVTGVVTFVSNTLLRSFMDVM